mgnify:CR=1 FL=1
MTITGEYVPSPSDWVRKQVETIERTGTTDSVDIMGLPVVMLTMRGARTGAVRKVPLMRVEHDGSFAVTKFGGESLRDGLADASAAASHDGCLTCTFAAH